jgi:malonyl-CoA O-methyltransferase
MIETEIDQLSTQAGYDRWAEIYDEEDNPLIALEEIHIPPLLGNLQGLSVADVGCGTGRHALRLANAGARVTAVDFSEAMLQRCRSKPGASAIKFVRHDLSQPLPLTDASFDRIVSCLVVDHIADLEGFFREVKRIGKPGGGTVISVIHPAMYLKGVRARFVDPVTGRQVRPLSYPHQISDYVMAVVRAGLSISHLSEHPVDEALASRSPRAVKYLGWPLLFLMGLRLPRPVEHDLD